MRGGPWLLQGRSVGEEGVGVLGVEPDIPIWHFVLKDFKWPPVISTVKSYR